MADKSAIEWTEATWNPTVGCSIVSPGCTNCYAMKVAHGLQHRFGSKKYAGLTKVVNGNPVWTGEVRLDEDALLQPLKWKRGRRIFVNSMSDLFHESLPDAAIDRVFAIMARRPQHTFQVLTKRAERMHGYMTNQRSRAIYMINGGTALVWPLPNVWLGVSCERQKEADERIQHLLATPAAVRFISAEPLLGPIDLTRIPFLDGDPRHKRDALAGQALMYATGVDGQPDCTIRSLLDPPMPRIDWVIAGGESGPNARPMHPAWARGLRDQCAAARVSYFFKQWGEHVPGELDPQGDAEEPYRNYQNGDYHWRFTEFGKQRSELEPVVFSKIGKKKAGRLLDGREHNEFPVAA